MSKLRLKSTLTRSNSELLMKTKSFGTAGYGGGKEVSDLDLRVPPYVKHYQMDPKLKDEIAMFAEQKKRLTMSDADEEAWRMAIKHELERELDRRVREALETPHGEEGGEGAPSSGDSRHRHDKDPLETLERLNSHIQLDLTDKEKDYMKNKRWKVIQAKRRIKRLMAQSQLEYSQDMEGNGEDGMNRFLMKDQMGDDGDYQGLFGMGSGYTEGAKSHGYYAKVANKALKDFGNLSVAERHEFFYAFTKNGFKEALRTGKLPDGSEMESLGNGKFKDRYGIIRDRHGPFWPPDNGPLFPAPTFSSGYEPKQEVFSKIFEVIIAEPRYGHKDLGTEPIKRGYSDIKFWPYGPYWPDHYYGPLIDSPKHIRALPTEKEPMWEKHDEKSARTVDNQQTPYPNKWRGIQIVFDSEKSCKNYEPPSVSEGNCPNLTFESRFESGNLRQARRIGQFEYELVLKCDLYTKRHTQWFYFRVQNAQPNVTYKFRIINLLKRDSLYNHGMKPLFYSEKSAKNKNVGWIRSGHHICYSRNSNNLQCPLLSRDRAFYMLEWQMEFPYGEDTCYLAHCYPYTFTDLRDDLDNMLADSERAKVMQREVLCETRAGNSCFLITVSDFDHEPEVEKKKGIVVSARVHPGETNSSWMMKGLLEFITGPSQTALALRKKFVFKIVPMINPDGVIVGNYRCSLAARDLNRNYRHPRKESFPTVYYLKMMMEDFSKSNEILIYCDLHGHSRKHNVFMYGCNTDPNRAVLGATTLSEAYLKERLFPWLMSQKSPDKFSFRGCKFQIKKAKESTGRVVMFRQMKILNSFTMEATFCGTSICRGDRRHFNTSDFRAMGSVFCEVVLDYELMQKDHARQSEVVLDLTRAITQQILETRGVLPPNLPDITTEAGKEKLKEYSSDGSVSSSEQIAVAFANMVHKEQVVLEKPPDRKSQKEEKEHAPAAPLPSFLDMDVNLLLDQMSSQTMEGCVDLLKQINVRDAEGESDSSDSDSESEPEMKYTDPPRAKRKKKKGKKKSKEDKSKDDKGKHEVHSAPHRGLGGSSGASGDHLFRPKSVANGLPSIGKGDESLRSKNKVNSEMNKFVKHFVKQNPAFVNKYAKRSNGGIPCFSEERLLERAAKRMAEMKKRMEEEQARRGNMYYVGSDDETGGAGSSRNHGGSGQKAPQSATELKSQFQHAFQHGAPLHIRTGYMHASDENSTGGSATDITQNPAYNFGNPPLDSSDSDSLDDLEDYPQRMPLTAMRNPYANVNSANLGVQPAFLKPIPARVGRLPKLGLDSCSIPLRHTNHGVQAGMQLGPAYGTPRSDTRSAAPGEPVIPRIPHRTDRKHATSVLQDHHTDHRSLSRRSVESDISNTHQSPLLMNKEYTDLILSRLRNAPRTNATSTFPMQPQPRLTLIHRKIGERHSTCE